MCVCAWVSSLLSHFCFCWWRSPPSYLFHAHSFILIWLAIITLQHHIIPKVYYNVICVYVYMCNGFIYLCSAFNWMCIHFICKTSQQCHQILYQINLYTLFLSTSPNRNLKPHISPLQLHIRFQNCFSFHKFNEEDEWKKKKKNKNHHHITLYHYYLYFRK